MTAPRRVLITGATGFIARHLIPEFLAGGWDVTGLHRHPERRLRSCGVATRTCDLAGGSEVVQAAVLAERPDLVVHLAAMIPEDRVDAAWSWIESNGRATEQLLAACRRCEPPPRVVVVSSGAVYGSAEPGDLPFPKTVRSRRPRRTVSVRCSSRGWRSAPPLPGIYLSSAFDCST